MSRKKLKTNDVDPYPFCIHLKWRTAGQNYEKLYYFNTQDEIEYYVRKALEYHRQNLPLVSCFTIEIKHPKYGNFLDHH